MTDASSGNSPGTRRRPRRRHPALASRIAVTGMSATTVFGIVAALGVAGASQDPTSSPETLPRSSPTLPVAPANTPTDRLDPTTTVPAPIPTTVPVTELSNQPIQLTANRVVRVVETPTAQPAPAAPTANPAPAPGPAPQQQAPVASTSGSR